MIRYGFSRKASRQPPETRKKTGKTTCRARFPRDFKRVPTLQTPIAPKSPAIGRLRQAASPSIRTRAAAPKKCPSFLEFFQAFGHDIVNACVDRVAVPSAGVACFSLLP